DGRCSAGSGRGLAALLVLTPVVVQAPTGRFFARAVPQPWRASSAPWSPRRRTARTSMCDGVWRIWRHSPGFSQKFNGKLSADGDTIEGLWESSRDDSTWAGDLAITFRRR